MIRALVYGLAILGGIGVLGVVWLCAGLWSNARADRRAEAIADAAWLREQGVADHTGASDPGVWPAVLTICAGFLGTVGVVLVSIGAATLITLLPGESPRPGWWLVFAGCLAIVCGYELYRRTPVAG